MMSDRLEEVIISTTLIITGSMILNLIAAIYIARFFVVITEGRSLRNHHVQDQENQENAEPTYPPSRFFDNSVKLEYKKMRDTFMDAQNNILKIEFSKLIDKEPDKILVPFIKSFFVEDFNYIKAGLKSFSEQFPDCKANINDYFKSVFDTDIAAAFGSNVENDFMVYMFCFLGLGKRMIKCAILSSDDKDLERSWDQYCAIYGYVNEITLLRNNNKQFTTEFASESKNLIEEIQKMCAMDIVVAY